MVYEFTMDDEELNESTDKGTMCNLYKINLPASASLLSKQIAKSQAKRAKKEERSSRRRVDLSTVREQDESKNSENSSPLPEVAPSETGRSRIDSAAPEVKLKRQNSFTPSEISETPKNIEKSPKEPIDAEEAGLLAMLLSGMEQNSLKNLPPLPMHPQPSSAPSPGLPRVGLGTKVTEWLFERSASPDDVSVISSAILDDSEMIIGNDDEEDEFFDAPEEVEHAMQGLSLNRNLASMTQSLVRVEEEITTTDGRGRSTSVSPRPTNEQFVRNANGSATFNVKHSSTLARLQKLPPPPSHLNGNLSSTPLSSRTTRSVLRVHNVNSINTQQTPRQQLSKSTISAGYSTPSPIGVGRKPADGPVHSTPLPHTTQPPPLPPKVTINPSTPSRPASVASSAGKQMQNLEGLQDLIQMQEDALRRAALDGQSAERKMSWHSDQEANRQSTSTHSSLGSLCSSKSIDGAHALSKMGGASRIPTPRSRLPTPRGSTLTKRVSIGVQTDIPWPPLCVSRHLSRSMPMLVPTSPTSASENGSRRLLVEKPPRAPSTRRMARSLLITSSNSYDVLKN